ncbi:MAG: NAD-dependent epimerase/dehydratase family protein [Candidatus Micrarchaeia archaeon]
MECVITGGAGFIGSHLADALIAKGRTTVIVDNLVEGKRENINPMARFFKVDLLRTELFRIFKGADSVFHFAADPFVRRSTENPELSFRQNVLTTFRVLEACRKADVKQIVFASSSVVYGEAKQIPTPEDAPLEPISNYGASKLAGEAYCSSYAHSYGIRATVLRYANIFGPRARHGVMWDFYWKLRHNPARLEILGDGKQKKSYLFVSDAISATLIAAERQKRIFEIFNVGSEEAITVNRIARVVCRELGVRPRFVYTGGRRGWPGDIPCMLLSIDKLKRLGWRSKVPFVEGVRRYLAWLRVQG